MFTIIRMGVHDHNNTQLNDLQEETYISHAFWISLNCLTGYFGLKLMGFFGPLKRILKLDEEFQDAINRGDKPAAKKRKDKLKLEMYAKLEAEKKARKQEARTESLIKAGNKCLKSAKPACAWCGSPKSSMEHGCFRINPTQELIEP